MSINLGVHIDLFQQEGEVAQHLVRGGLLKRHGCVSLLDKRLYYTWKVRRDDTECDISVPFSLYMVASKFALRTIKTTYVKLQFDMKVP